MKNKDLILIIFSTIAILGFIGYMYDFYVRTEENNLIRRDMYFDSLVLQEQGLLKKHDTLILNSLKHKDATLQNRINALEFRIKKIEEGLDNPKEN